MPLSNIKCFENLFGVQCFVPYLVCKHRKDIALRSYSGLFLSLWEHLLDLMLHNNNGSIVNKCLHAVNKLTVQ